MLPIFDGHLDLAMNALAYERDQRLPVADLRAREAVCDDGRGVAMVSLPELRDAGVSIVVATLLARSKPWVRAERRPARDNFDWPSADMAHAVALGQLGYYELLHNRGDIRLIDDAAALDAHVAAHAADPLTTPLGVIVMMEGADPITTPDEVAAWHEWGVRCVSLAHFGHSRYAAGTPPRDHDTEPDAPLTGAGRDLLDHMAAAGIVLDLTHLSDRSFAEAVERFPGRVCVTHANCRALAHTPRQLTDGQLRAVLSRGGVVGVAIHNGMLRWVEGAPPPRGEVSLQHVADHVERICELAGDARHVGLGTDLDGGYGRDSTPRELDTYRDLRALAPVLSSRGWSDANISALLHDNWLRFWRAALPRP